MAEIAVIVAAAGKSERFGGAEKKTFAKLDGRPVFLRTLELFIPRDDVCETILAVAPEDIDKMKSTYGANLGFMGIRLVEGGARRCDTVAAALKTVSEKATWVAVHDAARPCLRSVQIDAVFAQAQKTGGAILASVLTGTIKKVLAGGKIEKTITRAGLYQAQTPQVFRKDWLVEAYGRLTDDSDEITDDAQIVEQAGYPVTVVASDPTNLKITSKGDMALANAILKAMPRQAKKPRLGAFEEAQW